MKYGTNHFQSYFYAIRYYFKFAGAGSITDARKMVDRKLAEKEIDFIKPAKMPGRTVSLNVEEGRWFIEE